MDPAPRSRAPYAGAVLLGGIIVLLPLARGAVVPQLQLGAMLLLAVAAGLALRGEARLPWPAIPLLVILALLGLQAASAGWSSRLSLDPPASGRELGKAVAGMAAFLCAWAYASTRRRLSVVTAALAATGPVAALALLGGAALGATALVRPNFPLVNPNHLAGLLNLSSMVVLGMALRSRGEVRLRWLLAFLLSGSTVFLTMSRGGIGAFLAGVVVFLVLATSVRRDVESIDRPLRFVGLWAVFPVVVVVYLLAAQPLLTELRTLPGALGDAKVELWRPALAMIVERPLLGFGRGAFETAFAAFRLDGAAVTYTHLENEWLQPLIELGVPCGLLLIGTLGVIWARAARRSDLTFVEAGLLAGTFALALQGSVDFALEVMGVSIPFMVALGILARGCGRVHLGSWPLRLGGLTACGAGAAGLFLWMAHPTDVDAGRVSSAPDASAAALAATAAAHWHPADFLPPATAGARLVQENRCSEAMPWLLDAMAKSPTSPDAHLFAARCLAASGQEQVALREYRLAYVFGRRDALPEAARRYPTLAALRQVVPDSADGLLELGVFLAAARPADAATVFRIALQEHRDGRAELLLAHAEADSGNLEEALRVSLARTESTPRDAGAWRLASQLLGRVGRPEEAQAALRRGLEANPGAPPLVEAMVREAIAGRRFSEARRLAEEMSAVQTADQALRHGLLAAVSASQGRWGEAVERSEMAVTLEPARPWTHVELSRYLEAAGRLEEAITAARNALALPGPHVADTEARLERLRLQLEAQDARRRQQGLLGRQSD